MTADTSLVVVAAGQGRRMGGHNKALLALGDEPVLARVLRTMRAASCAREVVVVMNEHDVERLAEEWQTTPQALGADQIAPGGAERWLSARAGCLATDPASEVVLVHDAARALVEADTIDAVARAARQHGAALAAEALADTLKKEAPGGTVEATLPREGLWRAQTPQGARRAVMLAAFEAWPADGPLPTDEAMLLEAHGVAPMLVPGSARNFKLTTPDDLALARALLASP